LAPYSGAAGNYSFLGCKATSLGEKFPDVSEEDSALVFKEQAASTNSSWRCLTLKMKALRSFETSASAHPTTERRSQEEWNPQLHRLENLKTHIHFNIIVIYILIFLDLTNFTF
jgi:hypothetical protein